MSTSNPQISQTSQNLNSLQSVNNQQYLRDFENAILTTQTGQNSLNSLTAQQILNNQNLLNQQQNNQNAFYTTTTTGAQSVPGLVSNQGVVLSGGGVGNIQSVGAGQINGNSLSAQDLQIIQALQSMQGVQGGGTSTVQNVQTGQIVQNQQNQQSAQQQALQIQQALQLQQAQQQAQQQVQQAQLQAQQQVQLNSQNIQAVSSAGIQSTAQFGTSANSASTSQFGNSPQSTSQSQLSSSSSSSSQASTPQSIMVSSSPQTLPSSFTLGKCTPFSCRYDCIQYLGGFYCALDSQSGGISKHTATIVVISIISALLVLLLIGLIIWRCCMRRVLPYGPVSEMAAAGMRSSAVVPGSVLQQGSMYGGYGGSRVMAAGVINPSSVVYQGGVGSSGIVTNSINGYGVGGMNLGGVMQTNMMGYSNPGTMLLGSGAVHEESMVIENSVAGHQRGAFAVGAPNIGAVAGVGAGVGVGVSNVRTRTLGVVNHGQVRGQGFSSQANIVDKRVVNHGQIIGSGQTISSQAIIGGSQGMVSQEMFTSNGLISRGGAINQAVLGRNQSTGIIPVINEEIVYYDSERRMLPQMGASSRRNF